MTRDDLISLNTMATPAKRDTTEKPVDVTKQFTTPEHGAATQVWAAVSDELDGAGGVYLSDCRIQQAAPYAMDEARALALWDLSERLCTPSASGLGSTA
jgi:hypothetical protein